MDDLFFRRVGREDLVPFGRCPKDAVQRLYHDGSVNRFSDLRRKSKEGSEANPSARPY